MMENIIPDGRIRNVDGKMNKATVTMTDACRKSMGKEYTTTTRCGKRRVSVTRADNKQVKLPAKERPKIGQPGHAVLEERKTTPEEHPESGPENTHNSNGKCIVKYTEYS
jgi:hypothetical protein